MQKTVSIIIPAYNEEENIESTAMAVKEVCEGAGIAYEIVFVSDGSRDRTFQAIEAVAKQQKNVRGIEFSRNFGKEAAILAGLEAGEGDCFVVMDCDLQHPPATIPEMVRLWGQGYEVVEGIKSSRGDESLFYRLSAGLFYGILSRLSGFDMVNTSDFKLIDRRVAEILVQMPERKTFFRALSFWVGFKTCKITYDVAKRTKGKSKWSVPSLIKYGVNNIISFSSAPLNLVTYMGVAALVFSIILGIQTLVRYFMGAAIEGFTTVILAVLLMGGCTLIGLGLIGKYLAAIYDETKQRPRYIVRLDTRQNAAEDATDESKK